jgi:hypothetical protein
MTWAGIYFARVHKSKRIREVFREDATIARAGSDPLVLARSFLPLTSEAVGGREGSFCNMRTEMLALLFIAQSDIAAGALCN